jgi:hypothetical protein
LPKSNAQANFAFSASLWCTADEQRAAVPALKEEFDAALPEWVDDGMILRFLRQKKFDVDAAAEALTNHIAFVENTPIWDNARIEATLEYRAAIGYVLPAPDYFGRPIIYVRPRLINPAHRTNQDEVAQVFLAMVRDSTAICKRFGTEQCVVLYDLDQALPRAIATTSRSSSTSTSWRSSTPTPWATSSSVATRGFSFPSSPSPSSGSTRPPPSASSLSTISPTSTSSCPSPTFPRVSAASSRSVSPTLRSSPRRLAAGSAAGSAAAEARRPTRRRLDHAAAADDNDEDPLAGLTGEARAAKIAEIEKAELEGAKKIEADAAARDATKAASHTKQRRRRRKNKR